MYSWKTACELIIIYNFYNLCQDFAAGTNIKACFGRGSLWTADNMLMMLILKSTGGGRDFYLILEILNAILCLNTLCRPDLKMYKL